MSLDECVELLKSAVEDDVRLFGIATKTNLGLDEEDKGRPIDLSSLEDSTLSIRLWSLHRLPGSWLSRYKVSSGAVSCAPLILTSHTTCSLPLLEIPRHVWRVQWWRAAELCYRQ